jgi:choline dehydrogenase-like flavoprotein
VVREVVVSREDGKARGVSVVDAGTRASYELSGKTVVLAASTLETTRILLNSRSPRHPDGLGNSSGLLGSFLMDHPCVGLLAVIPELAPLPAPPPFRGPEGILVPRFRNLVRSDAGYQGGFGMFGAIQRRIFHLEDSPRERWSKILLVAYGEMLPRRENRVSIDPEVVDRHGIPALHVRCAWSGNEQAMLADMQRTVAELLEAAGARVRPAPAALPTPGNMVHEVGTARMGRDRRTSVLDPHNRCWDADNVLVVDGACWPSSGWQNPTLTMMALTVRACRHLTA